MKAEKGHIYFLGIGGIGMSALARFYHSLGYHISGYDLTSTELTQTLEQEGMEISYADEPESIKHSPEKVIYTPAIPSSNRIFQYFQQNAFPMLKRAQALGEISKDYFTIAVAGTHGKTTISSIIAHILKFNNHPVTAFVGGICNNYSSNLILSENTQTLVVEADEFDRSFLTLHPNIAVISSMDADHLDIYGEKSYLEESFQLFAQNMESNGRLYHHFGLSIRAKKDISILSYGIDQQADVQIGEAKHQNGRTIFEIKNEQGEKFRLDTFLPGQHNQCNIAVAVAICRHLGLERGKIEQAIKIYEGVKRRYDVRIQSQHISYIDDYAHHPTEIMATLEAVKNQYPGKKITVIFQPHLFSRTRDFADDFAQALSQADELLLMPIYPAREEAIEGVTSEWLLEKISTKAEMTSFETVMEQIKQKEIEVLLTLGAGSIDRIVKPLEEALS